MQKSRLPRSVVPILALLGILASFPVAGQDLTPLYNEFEILFAELGSDTLPYVQQFGLIMDGTGRAEVGKSFFFGFSAGAVFLPGIATFRGGENPLTFFDLDTLVGGLVSEPGLAQDIYNGSVGFFLDPGLRLTLGLALENGIEFWGHFGIFPQPVAGLVGGLVEGLESLTLNRFNAGGRVRFVLVKDQPGLPAVSLGVGYTHTQFNLGVGLAALPITGFQFSGFDVGLAGTLFARTRLHTAGMELALSKKLAIFAPFLRLGAWYQWASYTAGIEEFVVTLSDGTTDTAFSGTLDDTVQTIHDLSFVVSGGLELVLGKFSLILQGAYNTAATAPAANLSLQFRI